MITLKEFKAIEKGWCVKLYTEEETPEPDNFFSIGGPVGEWTEIMENDTEFQDRKDSPNYYQIRTATGWYITRNQIKLIVKGPMFLVQELYPEDFI